MYKLLLIAIVALFVTGCECCKTGPATSKHSGKNYFPIKVCSIGDRSGDSCLEYAAEEFYTSRGFLVVKTLDGHEYMFQRKWLGYHSYEQLNGNPSISSGWVL